MRKMGILLGSFALGLLVVTFAAGQQQPQKKKFGGGGFGGFGGFGGGGAVSPLTLLNMEQVKKELDVTEEQLEKVPAAVQKALANVLSDKQLKRLRQIDLQVRGPRAFTDAKVEAELKISTDQKDSIKTILEDSVKERQEIMKEAKSAGGGFQGLQEKFTGLDKETKEKVTGVLSADQRKQWKQLIGDEFKLDTPGFGGGGFKKKNKKDAE